MNTENNAIDTNLVPFPHLPFRRRPAYYRDTPIQTSNTHAYQVLQLLRELLIGEEAYAEAVALIDELLKQELTAEDEPVLQRFYQMFGLFVSEIES